MPARWRGRKIPALSVKFNKDPKQLGFFLAQVWICMQEYGPDIVTEGAKVQYVTMPLEGTMME